MREPLRATLFLAAALAAGCGGRSSAPIAAERVAVKAPHGGTISPVPGDRGFTETLLEPPLRQGSKAAGSALVVYFLAPDGKAAMATPPSNVSVELMVDRVPKTVTLTSKPKTDDPVGSARFASAPLSLTESRLEGDLNATIDGQSVTIPIAIH
jgi:hypothetical protein